MSKVISSYAPITSANGIAINTSVKCNSSNFASLSSREVRFVVMHYTGNSSDTASANARYFQGANRQASAHYFVDDSHIYQSVGLKDRAWHCGARSYRHPNCRNQNSIGIEMCCSGGYQISAKTKENAAALCAAVCRSIGITANMVNEYVLRHYDVTGKRCPAPMVSNNAEWVAFKESVKALLTKTKSESTAPATKGDTCMVELPVLSKGSKNGYVRTAQHLLKIYFDKKIAVDGDFGAATESVVRRYQSSRGLYVDGVIGAKTWKQLLC